MCRAPLIWRPGRRSTAARLRSTEIAYSYRCQANLVALQPPASHRLHGKEPIITPCCVFSGFFQVCFLYKLTEGACPKSYGHNVARLAGLPVSVVAQAAVKAAELEAVFRARAAQGEVEEDMPDAGADEGPLEIEKLAAMQSVLCAAGRGSSEMLMAAWRDLSRASG